MEFYFTTRFLPEESVKAGARLGPQWSSVCVGICKRRVGLEGGLPTQGALDVRAARVAYSGGACCLHAGRSGVCEQLPVWPER